VFTALLDELIKAMSVLQFAEDLWTKVVDILISVAVIYMVYSAAVTPPKRDDSGGEEDEEKKKKRKQLEQLQKDAKTFEETFKKQVENRPGFTDVPPPSPA